MAKKDCIEILKNSSLGLDIHKYLEEKNGVYDGSEISKKAYLKAAKELQEQHLNTIHNIFAEVGVSGYERLPQKESVSQTTEQSAPKEEPVLPVVSDNNLFHSSKTDIENISDNALINELGIHLGSKETADKLSEAKGGTTQQYDVDIKNPIEVPDFARWEAFTVSRKLNQMGIIDDVEFKRINNKTGNDKERELLKILKSKGYDGFMYDNAFEGGGKSYVAFDKSQVKKTSSESKPITNKEVQPSIENKNVPNEISELYNKRETLRFTIDALKRQMGGRELKGKSKTEYDKVVSEYNTVESKINDYEKSQQKIEVPKTEEKQKSIVEDTGKFKVGETVNHVDDLFNTTKPVKIISERGTDGKNKRYEVQYENGQFAEVWDNTLHKTEKTQPSIENKPSIAEKGKDLADKKVSAVFAGGKITGKITADLGEKIKILGDDGTKYTVRKTDILKEGETVQQHYESDAGKTEKIYEEIIGARPNNKTGRIAVDPIIGGNKPKRISEILFDVSKAIGKKIRYNKPSRSRAIGTYSPGSAVIKIRFAGDLDTTAHEIGHSIDDNFGILSDLKTTPNPIIEKELLPFSKHGSTPPAKHSDKRMYRLGEGFAEWLRAYIVNPNEAMKVAPEIHKLYESKVSDEYKKGLKQFSDDIRTWAAASGRDMVLSNIEWKPDENKKGIISKIFSKSDNSDMFQVSWVDKVAANMINPLQAFDKSIQYAAGLKGLDELLPKNDPSILARLLLSVDRKFGSFLETGFRDANDKLLTDKNGNAKTFNWLLEPLDNTDEATVKKEMEDTLAYMIAERTVGLGKRFDRESILSGIGGGIFKDVDVAKKALSEFDNGDPARLSRTKEAAERYRSYANDVLDYLVDKGRLTKEKLDKNGNLIGGVDLIKKNNLQYVALQRVMESSPNEEIEAFNIKHNSKRIGSKSEPIHTIKGSTRTIRNPYISLLDATYKGIKEADRNDVLRQYRDLLTQGRTMYEGVPIKLGDVGYVAKAGESNTIPIFIDGHLENWKFNDDIYKGLKGLDSDGYKLPNILTLHARILRNSITKFPVFAARNWVRDLQDRIIKSDSGFKNLFGDKKHWEDVARNGGLNAGYYMRGKDHYYGLMEEAIKDLSKDQKTIFADPSKIKKVWHTYEDFLQKSETANRVAEYRKNFSEAKKKGMDDYNASLYGAFRSRDLMDFALMGHYMKIVNQVIPFSNAAVQGLRSTIVRAAENPTAFLGRMALYTVLPQVALWGWAHRTKEDAEEYEGLPEYQRDMFWNIKIGKNKWLSVPKPYELGLFASGVDRGLSKAFGYNKNAFTGYAGSVFQTVSPFDMGSLSAPAQPLVETYTNKSLYSGKHVIPQQEDALDLSLRHTENATRLGQFIQRFSGIDARKIDYIIKSQFGYTGNLALDVSNIGKQGSRHSIGLHDLGFFNQSPAYNSQPVQNMVQFAEKYNLKQSREYVYFNKIAGKYFDAKTDAEKDDIAKQLVETANKTMDKWDKQKIIDKKTKAFDKKRND